MKYWLNILFLLDFLSGCATFGDRTVNVTEAQIQQKLNEKLAVPIQLLKVFDVNLSNSIVKFDQSTGRMQTTLDTILNSPLLDKSVAGKLSISGKLRFDAASQSIVLDEPQIDQFNVDGADSKQNEMINKLTKTLGGEMLNGIPLYTLKPEDLKFGGTNYSPKDIQITNKGLQLTFTPQH
ncbi:MULTISPECIES: DUF1439 domain-containing protein [Methylotenera]|uniref:DUF1439 domain-containing protein n=1 Tax=Methylotenera TaxID=359407 RepID=UPI0003747FBD|nr:MULTISPECIES: DUF1439 domain-containing protein [Methylotenera]